MARPPGGRTPRGTAGTGDRLVAMTRRATDGGYRFGLGGSSTLLVTDPALVREAFVAHGEQLSKGPGSASPWVRQLLGNGVLTSEGEVHRRQRRLVAPAFSARRARGHERRIATRAERRIGTWSVGAAIDVGAEMAGLTLEVAADALFGVELEDGRAAALRRSMVAAVSAYARQPAAADPVDHRAAELDDLVAELIRDPGRSPEGPDILATLLAATGPASGPGLAAREVRDCIVDLLLAGTETTASTLTWALHLLGSHPSVQHRLRAAGTTESGTVGTGNMGTALLRATLSETLRLYPPAWLLARTVIEPFGLGGRELTAGTAVLASPYAMHRDPAWFPSPGTFDPDRWLGTVVAPPPAFLPFGVGARSCLGESLAWVEMGAVLAAVLDRGELSPVSADPVPCDFAVTLRPARPILMELRT